LKFALVKPIFKMVVNMNHLTTDQYHCCQLSLKDSRRLYTIEYNR
jgi:hypothetical protein